MTTLHFILSLLYSCGLLSLGYRGWGRGSRPRLHPSPACVWVSVHAYPTAYRKFYLWPRLLKLKMPTAYSVASSHPMTLSYWLSGDHPQTLSSSPPYNPPTFPQMISILYLIPFSLSGPSTSLQIEAQAPQFPICCRLSSHVVSVLFPEGSGWNTTLISLLHLKSNSSSVHFHSFAVVFRI